MIPGHEGNRQQELARELLPRLEAEVPPAANDQQVVQEPDRAEGNRQTHGAGERQHVRGRAGDGFNEGGKHPGGDAATEDDQPAHRRRAALTLVALRRVGADNLLRL